MSALADAVRWGKALYVGISAYNPAQTMEAVKSLRSLGTPCLIHQPKYSMFVREPERGLLNTLAQEGLGCIAFSPLAQGLLSDRYLKGIPSDSRAARDFFLKQNDIDEHRLTQIRALSAVAKERGQTLAQMAIAWVVRDQRVTSALIGTSRVEQVEQNIASLSNQKFSEEELRQIDKVLAGEGSVSEKTAERH
jgi:L-glyceraldehyde 3-phosphate reductase